jgi:hypothetical protein
MEAAKHNFLLRFFNKKQKRREETWRVSKSKENKGIN